MNILTAKLGKNIINCYDDTYSKEQLKLWASKNILLCPVCGKPYEYCHGEFKIPYFRHKEKDKCEDIFSESETEEHITGKTQLYEWIKRQNGVTNAILEGWIPETHQRPDIMFEYQGEQFVIEYQCTPIASEYVKRHDLYQAAGIEDIWILGCNNYRTNRIKMIENFAIAYYSICDNNFIFTQYPIKTHDIFVIDDLVQRYEISKDKLNEYLKQKEKTKKCNQCIKNHYSIVTKNLNNLDINCDFVYSDKKSQYYTSKIYCNFRSEKLKDLTIFISPNNFDICYYDEYFYHTISSVKYDTFNIIAFEKMVLMIITRYLNKNKEC